MSGLRVGTLNCRSLAAAQQNKLAKSITLCDLYELDVIMLQETWLDASTTAIHRGESPEGWQAFYSMPLPNHHGSGLAIFIREATVQSRRSSPMIVADDATSGFQLLAVRFDSILFVSIYIFIRQEPTNYGIFSAHLAELRATFPQRHFILAGDFNHPTRFSDLAAGLAGGPQLVPLLRPAPNLSTHRRGNLLDNFFYTAGDSLSLLHNDEVEWTDHHLLVAHFQPSPGASAAAFAAPAGVAPVPGNFIDWRPLQGRRPMDDALLTQMRSMVKALSNTISMDDFNAELLSIARQLPIRSRHEGVRKPWWTHEVQQAFIAAFDARRLFERSRAPVDHAAWNAAKRAFIAARDASLCSCHIHLLERIARGEISAVSALYRRRRPPSRDPAFAWPLDPSAAASYWRQVASRAPDSADISSPAWLQEFYPDGIVPTIDITIVAQYILDGISAMSPSAPGPDGLDFSFLTRFAAELAPILAVIFTRALSEMPSALRLAETILLFKKDGPPTAFPQDYRPITLIPILMRLFLKVLDMRLRRELLPPPPPPSRRPSAHTRDLPFPWAQSGFMRHHSAHEPALLLNWMVSLMHRGSSSKRPLYGAFLDIKQAFDSIDHAHLLYILRDTIRLPQPWLEVIRRLLIGNQTTLLGTTYPISRGTGQGSPLSPLLCICFFQDLASALQRHLDAHPEDWPVLPPGISLPGYGRHVLLLTLLMYADDITLLATSRASLQRLLTVVSDWAASRGLTISIKSFAAVLCGEPADLPLPGEPLLFCGGVDLPWASGVINYLGVPFQTYERGVQLAVPVSPNLDWVLGTLYTMDRLLLSEEIPYCPYVPGYVTAVWQTVLNKALYPSQAIRLDLTSLDLLLNPRLRQILVLPPTYPTGLLRWELRLPPIALLSERMALYNAYRLVRSYPFFLVFIRLALDGGQWASTRDVLLASGPLHYLFGLFNKYHSSLAPPRQRRSLADRGRDVLLQIESIDQDTWRTRVKRAMFDAFRTWTTDQLLHHPGTADVLHSHAASDYGTRPPSYVSLGKGLAHVALRFKGPRLVNPRADDPDPGSNRPCNWCHSPAAECGRHFIQCSALPPALHVRLLACYSTISSQDPACPDPSRAFLQVCWSRQDTQSITECLRCMAHIIHEYRLSFDVASRSRVWAVPSSLL